MYSRRLFMGGAVAATALGLTACTPASVTDAAVAGQRQLSAIGLQTYTLREVFEDDPVGTLKMIKELGYDYVELNGRNFAERSAKDMISMVEEAGLYSPATHYSLEGIRDDFSKTVSDAQDLGVEYMIIPWIGDEGRTIENYKAIAAMMNERGKHAREAGFKLAYHNHQFEFFDLDGHGTTGMNILLNETDPDIVDFELDLFWARLEVADIPSFLRAHPGRFKLAHVKDMKGDPTKWKNSIAFDDIKANLMVNVGEGDILFEDYFALNEISGLKHFILEHDNPRKPFRASMKQSIDAARAMRF